MAETLNGMSQGEGHAPPLPDSTQDEGRAGSFPYASWGPKVALLGLLVALVLSLVLGIPIVIVDQLVNGKISSGANAAVQFVGELALLIAPVMIALSRGAASLGEALRQLGLRRFRLSALGWMAVAIGVYLLFSTTYTWIFGKPHQEDIAEGFGAIPVQVLVIVVAAPLGEEVCFRGMLFGGLRTRLPRLVAVLISGVIFGLLHAPTGVSAVPPLIAFGFVLALLYEKTGSIVPGILLHMLNNSVALLGQ